MNRAYLTFDIGTTSLKTALINQDGRALAVHTEEYSFRAPRADWAEMTPEAYWNAARAGIAAVLGEPKGRAPELAGIGFSSQGQTFVPIDSAGTPLYDAIVWTDNRAQEVCDEWEAEGLTADRYRHISGYPWLPAGLTLFKIAWLARNAPQAHRAWKFLCLPDYLIYRLTGETVTDHVMAQFSGLYDVRAGLWQHELLAKAGITEDQLPTVLRSGEVAGIVREEAARELGIRAGTPVCVGANDQICGAVGAGNVVPGIVSETTGTALAVAATTPELLDDSRMLVGRHAAHDRFFALPYGNTSAIVLKWFRDLCAPGEDYDAFLAKVESIPPGCEGVSVLPHFAGTASPTFNPGARGALVGLALGHTRAHIARAIMESCACMLREMVDLIRGHGVAIDHVRSLGGGAKSDAWLRMKADMLGVLVERPLCADAASLGAAMLAAAGVGQFGTIEEAARTWYRPSRVIEPDTSRFGAYDEVYARYLGLYEKLYGQGV